MGRYFVALKPIGTMPVDERSRSSPNGGQAPAPAVVTRRRRCRSRTGTAATRNRRVAFGVAGVLGALG